MRSEGKSETRRRPPNVKAHADNKLALTALGAQTPRDTHDRRLRSTYTVFHDTIETEWATWDGCQERVETVIAELGDFRTKPEDAYRRAARDARRARHGTDTVTQVAALPF